MEFVSKVELPDYSTNQINGKRSTLINTKGLSVTWTNLSVLVEQKKSSFFKPSSTTYKEIIHNVNGAVKAGTLVAILGASGSGKSTLMSVLADRNPGGLHVSGNIKIGRQPMGSFIRRISGFVFQDDLFLPSLTVLEHLTFTAKLKLDKDIDEKSRENLIHEIITELGLTAVTYSRIGDSPFGNEKINLSGGERKRLSVATELLTDPSLLFCDEPTTGLDSFTALKVVSNLEHLVKERQKTIICSIHQPNEKIIGLFQTIILLSNGKIAFNGSTEEALEFFKSQGYEYSKSQNAAVYLIQNLFKTVNTPEGVNNLCASFETSEYYRRMMNYIEMKNEDHLDPLLLCQTKSKEPPWLLKLWYTTHRSLKIFIRDSVVNNTKILCHLLISVLISLCTGGNVSMTQVGLQSLEAIFYSTISYNVSAAMLAHLDYVPKFIPVFFREYTNNTNTPSLFYTSIVFSMLPGSLFQPLWVIALIYWWTNLRRTVFAWLSTCLIIILTFNISAAFGMMLSICFSEDIANIFAVAVTNIVVLYSGIFNRISSIPLYLRWIRYLSWYAYAFEALLIIQVTGANHIECDANSVVPCLTNGSEVLASYGFDENDLYFNLTSMFLLYFFIHILSYIGILYKIRKRKM